MGLSDADREALVFWADTRCWTRHDDFALGLVARGASLAEIAEARGVDVAIIAEALQLRPKGPRRRWA